MSHFYVCGQCGGTVILEPGEPELQVRARYHSGYTPVCKSCFTQAKRTGCYVPAAKDGTKEQWDRLPGEHKLPEWEDLDITLEQALGFAQLVGDVKPYRQPGYKAYMVGDRFIIAQKESGGPVKQLDLKAEPTPKPPKRAPVPTVKPLVHRTRVLSPILPSKQHNKTEVLQEATRRGVLDQYDVIEGKFIVLQHKEEPGKDRHWYLFITGRPVELTFADYEWNHQADVSRDLEPDSLEHLSISKE